LPAGVAGASVRAGHVGPSAAGRGWHPLRPLWVYVQAANGGVRGARGARWHVALRRQPCGGLLRGHAGGRYVHQVLPRFLHQQGAVSHDLGAAGGNAQTGRLGWAPRAAQGHGRG